MPTKKPAPPAARRDWAYFLDLDGTLIELAAAPDAVNVDAALPVLLRSLIRTTSGAVALISGRALADLDARIGVAELPKSGQHGLERRDTSGRVWLHSPAPPAKRAIGAALAPLVAQHRGLMLEDKGFTLALHYRHAPELEFIARYLMHSMALQAGEGLAIQEGKCVVELKPADVNKGSAVVEYLREAPFRGRRPVFVGDDKNDEYGFAAANANGGLSICVGGGESCARYRLDNVSAVREWLGAMVKVAA